MTHEEFKEAAKFWKKKDEAGKKPSRETLIAAMEEYIQANNTCALHSH